MESDDEVRSLFLSGGRAGLDAAYRAYGINLLTVARRVLGEDEALDCVHDVLLRVWRRPGAYRPERGALAVFLHVSVRNEAIGRRRAKTRHLEIERRAVSGEPFSYGLDVTDHVERDALRAALAALPQEQPKRSP